MKLPAPQEVAEKLAAEAPDREWLRALTDNLYRRLGLDPLDRFTTVWPHMISYPLYLADYPLGHTIAFQIRQQRERAGGCGSAADGYRGGAPAVGARRAQVGGAHNPSRPA
jgi:hypothetical protein